MTENSARINKARIAYIPEVERASSIRNAALRAFASEPTFDTAAAYRTAKTEADATEARLRGLHAAWLAALEEEKRPCPTP